MAKIVHLRNIKRALQLEPSDGSRKSIKFVVGGRVNNFRSYKSFNFIDLVDGSSRDQLQVVIKKDVLRKPELGSYLVCQGDITSSPGAQQAIEFKVDKLNYLGKCDPLSYPLAETNKNEIADAWFRRNFHLRPRTSHFASLLRVRSELEMSMHMIFRQMDFFKVHTPILTANDSEASSDLFMVQRSKFSDNNRRQQSGNDLRVETPDGVDELAGHSSDDDSVRQNNDSNDPRGDTEDRHLREGYFRDKDVFMITSAQLHLESLAASLSRVYCLAPAFRAESSLSQRHLCEFTMLEAEEANVTSLNPLMDRVESVVKFCLNYLGEVSEFKADFDSLLDKYSNGKIYEKLNQSSYIRMSYDEAIEVLQRRAVDCHHGCDLNRKHERALLEHCNNVPIFLTNYPKSLKPFYMKTCDNSPDKVQNFDLIAPFGGEICGGSLREDNLEMLLENLNLNESGRNHEISPAAAPQLKNRTGSDAKSSSDPVRDQRQRQGQPKHRFDWYLELREFGTYPHGGFGIGLERLIQSMLGIKNIKDTIAFPRWPGHCSM